MSLRGGLELAGGATAAGVRVSLDAVRDRFGGALPLTPEQLAQPDTIGALLGRAVRGVRLPGVTFDSSNCQNFLVEIDEFDGPTSTLYAKLPAREVGPRVFANTVGYWNVECVFCDRVAPHVPVRVPAVHAVTTRGSRFVLLLENVATLPGARMFVNADMAAGTTIEQARRCLSAFADLHAGMYDRDPTARDRLLPLALHPQLAPRRRAAMHTLNRIALKRAATAAPELVTPTIAATYGRALNVWEDLLRHWYRGPLTLVHGDSHLANCFEYDTDEGPRVGLLDFQGVHWSKGIRDVAYCLIHSLDTELLAANEPTLVDYYIDEMARRGVHLGAGTTHEDYRAFSFQALMVGVVAVGLGGFTEREATVRTMLRRETAAVERLDFAGWLAANSRE